MGVCAALVYRYWLWSQGPNTDLASGRSLDLISELEMLILS